MKSTLVLALAASLLANCASAAVLVVVEARGVALKPGATLDSTKPLTLTQGQHVTLVSDTGSTLKLDGPYNRPPVAAGGSGGVNLANTMAALVTQRQARAGEFGVTRGTVLAALPKPWLVDATHAGAGCLQENHLPVFWRPASTAKATLAVAPLDHSWRAEAPWPAGQDRMSITTEVPIRPGETYLVTLNGAESAITMVPVPAILATSEMRAAYMADRGCEAQAEAIIKTEK
jgi:hypothetical protein